MKTQSKALSSFAMASIIFLSACAGREATPVQVIQSSDHNLSCSLIHAEANANSDQIRRLIQERAKTNSQNAAVAGVGVILFAPALFALNLKGAAKEEANALIQRNQHLLTIAKSKGCPLEISDPKQV